MDVAIIVDMLIIIRDERADLGQDVVMSDGGGVHGCRKNGDFFACEQVAEVVFIGGSDAGGSHKWEW